MPRRHLRSAGLAFATFVVLAAAPATSTAAYAPPTLTAPATATKLDEGGTLKFEWTGDLQGHATALERSFFRVEVILASKLPADPQTEWTDVAIVVPTEPGVPTAASSIGVPAAADYRWRVCAMGVIDPDVENSIQQLPGGCSDSRAFVTVAVAADTRSIGSISVEERKDVDGSVEKVQVQRPQATTKDPVTSVDTDTTPTSPVLVSEFSPLLGRGSGTDGGNGSVGDRPSLDFGSNDAFGDSDSASSREGIASSVGSGLNATLPLVPIPFWTLAMLLACIPIARGWRRNVLRMFDWGDGSIDGRGTVANLFDDLADIPDAQTLKIADQRTDGDAEHLSPANPDGGRHAA